MLRHEKITSKIHYPKQLKKVINRLKPYVGGEWDDSNLANVKKFIRNSLSKFQSDCCAYCGLPLKETSGDEIEHIAPKGGPKYPKYVQFTFTPYNLVLSCHYCNSPTKKGRKDTVEQINLNYRSCQFKIVHPYFDDPKIHFSWVASGSHVLISGSTPQGIKSIEFFNLDDTAHNEARARVVMYEKERFDPDYEERLRAALQYKGLI